MQQIDEKKHKNLNLFDQLVENANQILHRFDRQVIQNNFFNLQTNEVQAFTQQSHSVHSPFIDIKKVFPNVQSLDKTASMNPKLP